jgi:iron complex outermembrane receptor protein
MKKTLLCASASLMVLSVQANAQVQAEAGAAPTAAPAAAMATGGEIIVTAQRRAERLQDVPISITAIGAEALANANVQQLGEIAKLTPALRFDYTAAFAQPTIRGVGTPNVTSGGGANVGIYVDGFYSPNPLAADFQLMNVEGIQVLKGPQGTLFGRNTTGGAILVTTSKPSTETRGAVEVSYGSYDTRRLQAYATTGLTDRIAIDLEGLYRASDGFIRNVLTGQDDAGRYENWTVRAGLNADVTETLSVLFRYTHQDTDDRTALATNSFEQGGQVFSGSAVPPQLVTTQRKEVTSDPNGVFRSNSDAYQITTSLDLDFGTLTSYTQWRDERTRIFEDLDHTGADVVLMSIPVNSRTFTQELLLASDPGRLTWTAGLFYFNNRDEWRPIETTSGGGPFTQVAGSSSTTKSYAGYLDVTYELVERLFLSAGARYSHDEVEGEIYSFPGYVPAPRLEFDRVTPRAVLRYELNDRASAYASFAQGYKAGILDLAALPVNAVRPEKISAYEVGFKHSSREFSFDIAGYYYDYKDLQVSSFPNGLADITNAANSRIWGIESQVRYQFTPAFELSGGLAYVDAKYKDFENSTRYVRCNDPASCGAITGFFAASTFDASGFRMLRSPELTGNVGARYTIPLAGGELGLSGNLYYTSSFYFDLSEQFRQDDYALLGLRAEWTDPSERFTFAVFGDNVTDTKYRSQVQYNSFGIGSTWGYPATVGVSARARL